jgi:hypothetical protein
MLFVQRAIEAETILGQISAFIDGRSWDPGFILFVFV